MKKEMSLAIARDGTLTAIYDDALRDILDEGRLRIRRASTVEPDLYGNWWADMTPSGHDVKLGPFKMREDALRAERAFLTRQLFSSRCEKRFNRHAVQCSIARRQERKFKQQSA